MSQGPLAASTGKKTDSPLESPDKIWLDFTPTEAHVGLLTSRTTT